MGLMGVEIPEKYDGAGGTFMMSIARLSSSPGSMHPWAFLWMCKIPWSTMPLNFGSDHIQAKYLTQLATKKVGAYCLSEASSGSDAFALKATAKEDGDHYVLNGAKLWITNANEADIFIVFATVNPEAGYKGIILVVERSFEGFSVAKKEDKLGIRASSTCEILLEDCRTKENILGELGKGYKVAIETLNEGRIGIGAQMIGLRKVLSRLP